MQQKIASITQTINDLGVKISELSPIADNEKLLLFADSFNNLVESWKSFASIQNSESANVNMLPKGAIKYETFLGVLCPMNENGSIVDLNGNILHRNQVNKHMLEYMFANKQIEFQQKKNALIAVEPNAQTEPKNISETISEVKIENNPAAQSILSPTANETFKDFLLKPTLSFIKNYKTEQNDLVEIFNYLKCEVPEHLPDVNAMSLASIRETIHKKISEKNDKI